MLTVSTVDEKDIVFYSGVEKQHDKSKLSTCELL